MAEPRRFARLRRQPTPGTTEVPDDGMCLSAFLLVHPADDPRKVLLGRPAPDGPWEEAAGLDTVRLAGIGDRWVLPASQLLLFEGPAEAAERLARELLGRPDLRPGAPRIFSEAYSRPATARDRGTNTQDPHWDLHFVFPTTWPGGSLDDSRGRLWRELRFLDMGATASTSIGRGHGDVLALAGVAPSDRGRA